DFVGALHKMENRLGLLDSDSERSGESIMSLFLPSGCDRNRAQTEPGFVVRWIHSNRFVVGDFRFVVSFLGETEGSDVRCARVRVRTHFESFSIVPFRCGGDLRSKPRVSGGLMKIVARFLRKILQEQGSLENLCGLLVFFRPYEKGGVSPISVQARRIENRIVVGLQCVFGFSFGFEASGKP